MNTKNLLHLGGLLVVLAFEVGCPADPAKTPGPAARPSPLPAASQPAAVPTSTQAAASPDDGKSLFMRACVTCHGLDGSGQQMRPMMPEIGDLTQPATHDKFKDDEIQALIANGKNKMPPFGTVLSPDQMKSIVAYVRTLKRG